MKELSNHCWSWETGRFIYRP